MHQVRLATGAVIGVAIWIGGITAPLAAQATLAEVQAPTHYAGAIAFSRTLIDELMETSGTPGMSVAVGIDGEIVWAEGFGYANVEHRVPVWEETKFRIGSVSKPLTAAAVGLLIEQGKLDLDAPVQRYVPSFPEKRWPITPRLLAGHLSGMRHYRGGEMLSAQRYRTVSEGLTIFQDDSLLFEPGERYSYSSYAWNLISAVVEGASGEDFLGFMQANVFDALGMTHTVAEHTDSIIPHRTGYYHRSQGGWIINAPSVDNSYKWAGGGFISTPSDLVRFGFAHLGEDLLQAGTIRTLWTPQTTNAGRPTGYGIGWYVTSEDGVVTRASHGGGSVGGTAGFLIRPSERAVVAILGNMSQAPTGGLILTLITDAFLDPETLTSSAGSQRIAGEFECVATRGAEQVLKGTMMLGGTTTHYWGRIAWDNDTVDRIIYSSSKSEMMRLVTVDDGANLLELEFTEIGPNQLSGDWRSRGSGEVTCGRR